MWQVGELRFSYLLHTSHTAREWQGQDSNSYTYGSQTHVLSIP